MNIWLITFFLVVWNLFVLHYLSRWFYCLFRDNSNVPAEYVGRKVVHILNGGVTTIFVALFYEGYYWIVVVAAFLLAVYIYLWRKHGMLYWFQVADNIYEVHFALAYAFVLFIGILLDDVWVGLIPMFFMSFGDAVTGLVRAFTRKRRVKSWDGTLAMFLVCGFIGFLKFGLYGVFMGVVASLVEKIPKLDDNLTVPLVSGIMVYLYDFFNFL